MENINKLNKLWNCHSDPTCAEEAGYNGRCYCSVFPLLEFPRSDSWSLGSQNVEERTAV